MVLYRKNPSGKRLKYKRPDIWENKTKEEIKNTLLHIIDTEGVEPFIKSVNQEKSNIDIFFDDKTYLLDEPIENIVTEIVKNNINEISEFIYNYNAFGAVKSTKFNKPVYFCNDTGKRSNTLSIGIDSRFYDWSEYQKGAKDFYKYYYRIYLW